MLCSAKSPDCSPYTCMCIFQLLCALMVMSTGHVAPPVMKRVRI